MSNTYIYCFIRKDLPVTHQLIQLGHACHEAGKSEKGKISNMVLFEVENEEELLLSAAFIFSHKIFLHLFREPDMKNECTAICTEVIPHNSTKRAVFKDFKLYK